MRARLIAASLLAAIAGPVAAHDFWIDLPSYRLPRPGRIEARFLIGDAAAPEPWQTAWRRIVSLVDHAPAGVEDLQAAIRPDEPGRPGGASILFDRPGTHMIALATSIAESDLPAAAFDAYARHEGLTPALAARAMGPPDARGRELYSRRAKAIVQVGAILTDQVTRPIGQTLEIVPARNPYALAPGEPLTVAILYHGRPLAGATVVAEPLDPPARPGVAVRSDAAGRATLPLGPQRRWRIAVVWTQPIVHLRADFDTVFASLTFG